MNEKSPIPQNFNLLLSISELKILIGGTMRMIQDVELSVIFRDVFPPRGDMFADGWPDSGSGFDWCKGGHGQRPALIIKSVKRKLNSCLCFVSMNACPRFLDFGEAPLINALSLSTSDITTSRGTRVGRSFVRHRHWNSMDS